MLGAMLSDPAALNAASEIVAVDDFSTEAHRKLYSRILTLQEARKPIDLLTVGDELRAHGELDSVGGFGYLVSLGEGIPKLSNIASYAEIVAEKSRLRRVIYAAQEAIDIATSQRSTSDKIVSGLIDRLYGVSTSDKDGPIPTSEYVESYEGGLDGLLSPKAGIPTGFSRLDDMLDGGGLQPETLVVVGAESSRGKSAFAANIAMNLARREIPVAFYSLEMSRRSLFHRAICCDSAVSLWKFKHNYLTEEERLRLLRSANRVAQLPIYWDCRSGLSLNQLQRRLTRLYRERSIALAVIDYLQIMDWSEGGVKEMRHGFVRITKGVKELARDLKIPIILLSQLRRDPSRRTSKDPRPRLSDLRESSSIENDADAVILLYRPEFDHPNNPEMKGIAELIVAKQRDGPTGVVNMRFEGSLLRFSERETSQPDARPDQKTAASGTGDTQ